MSHLLRDSVLGLRPVVGSRLSGMHGSWATRGPQIIADDWVKREAERRNAAVVDGAGLLGDITLLEGDTFNALDLAEPVVSFYENTTAWSMEVSHRWSLISWPVGWLISKLFTQRLQQLDFPIKSSNRANPIESKVVIRWQTTGKKSESCGCGRCQQRASTSTAGGME